MNYSWAPEGELQILHIGDSPIKIGIGLQPHVCEPLGSVILPQLSNISKKIGFSFLVFTNIEPAKQEHQFSLDGDVFEFLNKFHLPPISEQVEFGYGVNSRSELIKNTLLKKNIKTYIQIHNDPFTNCFYEYANCEKKKISDFFKSTNSYDLPDVSFTNKLAPYTYHFFKTKNINTEALGEAAGVHINDLGIQIRNLEIPIFKWNSCKSISKAQEIHKKIMISNIAFAHRKILLSNFKQDFSRVKVRNPMDTKDIFEQYLKCLLIS